MLKLRRNKPVISIQFIIVQVSGSISIHLTLSSVLYKLKPFSFKAFCHFNRVQPYVSLNYLRDHIEEQLGPEIVPEDYVFLRSVGRCMAVVSMTKNLFSIPKKYETAIKISRSVAERYTKPLLCVFCEI